MIEQFFAHTMPLFLERLIIVVTAPLEHQEMIWILFPAITTMLLMTIYFGRYRREELGWNTAVGNALVLIFVSLNLFEQAYPQANPIRALTTFFREITASTGADLLPGIVASIIFLYAFILLIVDFFHWLPKKAAFFISSPLPINTIAYFGIVFVYSATANNPLALDGYTLASFITIFLLLYIVLGIIQFLEPHKREEEEEAYQNIRREFMDKEKSKKKEEHMINGFVDDQEDVESIDEDSQDR